MRLQPIIGSISTRPSTTITFQCTEKSFVWFGFVHICPSGLTTLMYSPYGILEAFSGPSTCETIGDGWRPLRMMNLCFRARARRYRMPGNQYANIITRTTCSKTLPLTCGKNQYSMIRPSMKWCAIYSVGTILIRLRSRRERWNFFLDSAFLTKKYRSLFWHL